jgi:hypothetical protein
VHYLRSIGKDPAKTYSIKELSKFSKVPERVLKEVEKRGAGAWRTNLASVRLKADFSKNPDTSKFPRSSRLSQRQWALARVYSFLDKGETYRTADSDLARLSGY